MLSTIVQGIDKEIHIVESPVKFVLCDVKLWLKRSHLRTQDEPLPTHPPIFIVFVGHLVLGSIVDEP